jgi:cysteine desulfurase
MIYLDNNATTRPSAGVCAAMNEALTASWANPSSVHRAGQEARARVELARRAVADLLAARPRSITFTGSGTEAIDLAIRGSLAATGRRVIVTDAVEHAAVRDLAKWLGEREGVEVRLLPVDLDGVVDVGAASRLIDASVAVVSVQWANNETGVIQPVEEIGRLCRGRGVAMHCDATQWVGKAPAAMGEDGGGWCDVLTLSPHKFHGPKGVGVLWLRQGVRLAPTIHGTQEGGRRGGTENVPGILGAGAAAVEAAAWLADGSARERLGAMRDAFEAEVLGRATGAVVNGTRLPATPRIWSTTNIAFPRLEAEALLLLLSERGVCASAGAACSSGSLDPSPVLLAMGVPAAEAHGSVRFSLSRETTEQELRDAAAIIGECVAKLRGSMVS